jgi:hypothetical protein
MVGIEIQVYDDHEPERNMSFDKHTAHPDRIEVLFTKLLYFCNLSLVTMVQV